MTAPLLTNRDALAEVLCDVREDNEHAPFAAPPCRYCLDLADAVLASGVVRAVDGLAEDEGLVILTAETWQNDEASSAEIEATGGILRALAAALATPTDPSEAW